jgi:Ca2+-binding RTX toxin-like protein
MADLSGTIAPGGFAAWVYDPHRDQIFVIVNSTLMTWSVPEQRFAPTTYSLGFGEFTDIDISPDGGYLLATQRYGRTTRGPDFEAIYNDGLVRVDLPSYAVQQQLYPLELSGINGAHDVTFAANGLALVTSIDSRRVRLVDSEPTGLQVTGNILSFDVAATRQSEDLRYVLIQDLVHTSGPLRIYDSLTGVVTPTVYLNQVTGEPYAGWAQYGGDISSAAGMAVTMVPNRTAIFVFDLNLNMITRFNSFAIGAEFNNNGRQLFLWRGTTVDVLDTQTWQTVASLSVANASVLGGQPFDYRWGYPFGMMDVASSGRLLLLDFGTGLEIIDLSARLKINLQGDNSNQALHGAIGTDTLSGFGGVDTLMGYGGNDRIFGGDGSDSIDGGAGNNFLRGDDGDDWIVGGADTDDAHGNIGNDTVHGGAGDDWVVGGKDNDVLYGDDGGDVSLGNLGSDTIDGGAGDDVVRGGQQDDLVLGGAGNDWVSGDRGTDTLTGGAGADNFHVFDGSGADRVTDFNAAEGDRVWLLPGAQWSAAQVGADTVVTVSGAEGGQLVLVGVTFATLPSGWIFGA